MKLPRKPFAWKLGQRKSVFENDWIDVNLIAAQDPNGRPAHYGLVHFKNLAIGIIPYENGHIWLVGQSRVSSETYSWEIAAGGGSPDIDPIETAARELKEETGFKAEKFTQIVELETSNSVTDERAYIFLATGLKAGEKEPESSEDITVMKISLDDAVAAVDAGEIRHSLGVSAIYKLALMQKSGELDGL